MTSRRKFLALAASSLVPMLAQGQAARKPIRLAWLSGGSMDEHKVYVDAFLDGMKSLGYQPGRDYNIEYFWRGDSIKPFAWLARDVIASKPDIILATCEVTVGAVRKLTSTIPIVMTASTDPVASGVVASLSRPGGNVTGVSSTLFEVTVKRVEILKEILPRAEKVALLQWRYEVVGESEIGSVEQAAKSLGMSSQRFFADDEADFDKVMGEIRRARFPGVVDLAGLAVSFPYMKLLPDLALKYRLPVVHFLRESVENGGLVSFGSRVTDGFRRSAYYVDRLAKGAKPAELPIEQPSDFEICVNLNTARAMGIAIPQSILLRAKVVIG
jgi:putative ABC transport system substrate-binding protein